MRKITKCSRLLLSISPVLCFGTHTLRAWFLASDFGPFKIKMKFKSRQETHPSTDWSVSLTVPARLSRIQTDESQHTTCMSMGVLELSLRLTIATQG